MTKQNDEIQRSLGVIEGWIPTIDGRLDRNDQRMDKMETGLDALWMRGNHHIQKLATRGGLLGVGAGILEIGRRLVL